MLLTMLFGTILANHLDALSSMYLFHLSTCFEQRGVHHQELNCINTSSGMYYVGDCLVCRSGPAYQAVTYID